MSSRSLNRVTLIGNLTRDPELKYTPQGTAVCSFGVATNRSWVTATGELKEDVQYHRIVAWQKLAELCGKILTKGKKVYLEGRITYRNYIGKDGVQRTITEIVLDDFVLLETSRRVSETPTSATPPPTQTTNAQTTESPTAPTNVDGSKKDGVAQNTSGANKLNSLENTDEEKIEPEDIPF